ncbi:MAG TPA: flavin reductase, partial [Aggregatilineaceae bacterium]|nr:flavin reductase [Aggregatilineaceae bacterium]
MGPDQALIGESVSRQVFRRSFQPSRLLVALVPTPEQDRVNAITLSFSMWCSYKPRMLAIAVQNCNYSYECFESAKEYTLTVPGESLVKAALAFGTISGRSIDKIVDMGVALAASATVSVPALAGSIAALELVKHAQIVTGDHMLVVGRVTRMARNHSVSERPLLSIGPDTTGYELLFKHGQHRIAVVGRNTIMPTSVESATWGLPMLIVLVGPTAAGKTTLIKALRDRDPSLRLVGIVSTRQPRRSESDRQLVSDDEFRKMEQDGQFKWVSHLFGRYYGTSAEDIDLATSSAEPIYIMDLAYSELHRINELGPYKTAIMVLPPSEYELTERLELTHRSHRSKAAMEQYQKCMSVVRHGFPSI